MPPKRPNDSPATGRERKKQKTVMARTIAVQSSEASTGNATAGPSKSVRFDSMKGLPGALDVEKFAEARAFEIKAMHDAMENARSNATHRAWQHLPRHLRRRAASHDVRRVPLRLRDKARAEMDAAPKKRKPAQRGKSRQIKRTTLLLRRQKDKTWLETHLWHAKRMHMDTWWGYKLALTPTEKAFRPSHRASVHGSILHDASYYALIEVKGPEDILRNLLDSCCDCQGPSPGAKRFLGGARTLETHIYGYASYPFDLLAPATILWQPETTPASGKGKGKEKQKPSDQMPYGNLAPRVVWIRVHPAAITQVHESVRNAASFALDAFKEAHKDHAGELEVEIGDLRDQTNMFEIMGPKSSQVIKSVLTLAGGEERSDVKKFLDHLGQIQTTASVPRGMVVGFTVHDPRLSFPPKNAKIDYPEGATTLAPALTVFPSASLAQSLIWQEDTRQLLRRPLYQKKQLDHRRSNNLIPGTPLQPTQKDNKIPVLLIQRSIEDAAPHRGSSTAGIHGWTLVVPQGWAMAFFSSLIHTGTRVGGLDEVATQAFEARCAAFPHNYPCTDAYEEYAETAAATDRKRWERRPPAKRPNYRKLGTRSPWRADWGVVLGVEPAPSDGEDEEEEEADDELLDAQRDAPMPPPPLPSSPPAEGEHTEAETKAKQWLLRGPDVYTVVQDIASMLNPAAGLLMHVNAARAKRRLDPLDPGIHADELLKGALVQIRVLPCGRGHPKYQAVIYSVDDEEARTWAKAEKTRKNGMAGAEDGPDETELSQSRPSPDSIIGYVTTGNFSLSMGEGRAIGALPLARYLQLKTQSQRLGTPNKLLVKLRNRDEVVCRAGWVELL